MFSPYMPSDSDTIFAVATGLPATAIAVVRVSGPKARDLFESMTRLPAHPQNLRRATIRHPVSGEILDEGMAVWFSAPRSYTGEDYFELHIHGGQAVIGAVLNAVGVASAARLAAPGEFSRRAFLAGKMDLASIEGLADLLEAQTESQRRQALGQASGALASRIADWRIALIGLLARAEAVLDFPDEADAPDGLDAKFFAGVASASHSLRHAAGSLERGEIIRDGFKVAIVGAPNVGKSSLLNAIAGRSAAIVTDIPGTTRDLVEVMVDVEGLPVRFVDTAGLRETSDLVEVEGIKRARDAAEQAHLVLWLAENAFDSDTVQFGHNQIWKVQTKADLNSTPYPGALRVSMADAFSVSALLRAVGGWIRNQLTDEPAMVVRRRQRDHIDSAADHLEWVVPGLPVELISEHIRSAVRELEAVIGAIEVEDVLGDIFSRFCIGK